MNEIALYFFLLALAMVLAWLVTQRPFWTALTALCLLACWVGLVASALSLQLATAVLCALGIGFFGKTLDFIRQY